MTAAMSEKAMLASLAAALEALPTFWVCHRKGEKEGEENRPLYSVQLHIIRHSAWVAGYGWPDYEAPFVTGPAGIGAGALITTLTMLAVEIGRTPAPPTPAEVAP